VHGHVKQGEGGSPDIPNGRLNETPEASTGGGNWLEQTPYPFPTHLIWRYLCIN